MVRERESFGLPRLGHHVRRVEDGTPESCERITDPGPEQGGDGAGEQAPRTKDDDVRRFYGGDHSRRRLRPLRLDRDPRYRFADRAHYRLPAGHRSVGVADREREALGSRRVDAPLCPQEPRRLLHALTKTPGHVRECRNYDVADRVVGEVPLRFEAVVEDLGEFPATGERHEAVPHVTRWRHPQFLPEPTTGASVIRNGHDRGEVPGP